MDHLNIDWLKQNHQMIHYFGLGFIQLKIDLTHRLHFYTPELPPITPWEDVHNHRYDFWSSILKGALSQALFQVVDGDSHVREQESCQEGVMADTPGVPCGIVLASKHHYQPGSEYWVEHQTFHQVVPQVSKAGCITYVTRSEYRKPLAEVIRPKGATKVCPFSQKVEESRLWEIVESMLR